MLHVSPKLAMCSASPVSIINNIRYIGRAKERERRREQRYCGYIPLYDIPTKSKKHSYAFNIAAALV